MQAGGALVGGVLLLFVPGWWFVAVAVLLAVYEVAVWRAGSGAATPVEVVVTTPIGPRRVRGLLGTGR